MAEAVVSASMGAMNSLLPKLSGLIEGEYELQKSVKSGIFFLREELSSMNALLLQLANNEERLDEQSKEWRNKVRELSYDFEDCIDLFIHKLKRGEADENILKKITKKIKNLRPRHNIAKLIQELKSRVEEESARRQRYKLDESVASMMTSPVHIDPRLPAIYEEAHRLVGIDGPREKIIEWLMNEDSAQQLKVVSIVGFGGLGKTTLATQVHNKIKGQFHCTAFVPVSRSPNIKKNLTGMLKEVGGSVDSSDDERQLIGKIRSYLQDKRYLIIVDDIWSTDAWGIMKSALPENSQYSRIITTTRKTNVAMSCASFDGYIHNIEPLSDEDSQKLFYKRVFGSEYSCPLHLKEVSQAIIKKCHGLPLAIITIASLLAIKSDARDEWEQVRDSMASALSSEKVGDILLLSYYELPYHLKTCFLYLSVFPEDYEIQQERLIWMWIAEGFIVDNGQSLQQIGENYFNDLINRSLIQPVRIRYDGKAQTCRVHDMVLDLVISLCTQANFATIVEGQVYKCLAPKIRRLSLLPNCVGNEVMQDIMEKCSHVRSFISFEGLDKKTYCLSKFDSLRVLVLEDSNKNLGNQHIKYIGSFFQLKYLRIHSSGVTELPGQLGGLQNLQTLDVSSNDTIEMLPPTIGCLRNLVRLLLSDTGLCDEVGDLQALEVLLLVRCGNSVNFVGQLGRLTNLRVLDIMLDDSDEVGDHDTGRYQEAVESSLTVLGKHGLESLDIIFEEYPARDRLMDLLCCDALCLRRLCCSGFISRVPQKIASLVNLVHLDIDVIHLKQEDLCMLGGMPTLLHVSLCSNEAPSERLIIGCQQFPCLKEFHLWSYGDGGRSMVCKREAMPKLRILGLNFEAKEAKSSDMGFEFSFEHLASLEQLDVIINCFGGATRSRVEAAEERSQHPSCTSHAPNQKNVVKPYGGGRE